MNRKVWWWIGGAVVAIALVAVGGPFIYAKLFASDAPPQLSVSSPTPATPSTTDAATPPTDPSLDPAPTPATQPPARDINGTWVIGEGSQAGYRVDELLSGQQTTAVGRTSNVSGSLTVEANQLTTATITVDTASLRSDRSPRDSALRDLLQVSTYPDASFTLSAPVAIGPELLSGDLVDTTLTGVLQIGPISTDVTVNAQAVLMGNHVSVSGQIPITFRDYEITAPNLGTIKVEDQGTVEFLISADRT